MCIDNRIEIEKAAMVFRALNGDRDAYSFVTLEEANSYTHANTFEEFLQVNNIETYEEVAR